MRRLVNRSFMSNYINLLLLWNWILCKSWATLCEFLVMKVFGKLTKPSNFLFSNLAVLYAGLCRLFITGRIGAPSFCVFIYAFRLGTLGFIFIRYFNLSLLISKLHVWRACCVRFWKVLAGSFFNSIMWFSWMKLWTAGKHYIWICFTNKVYWSPNNKLQTLTYYSIWQPSHVTYRPLPLTVVPSPSYRAHTPQGMSRSTSSIVILSS